LKKIICIAVMIVLVFAMFSGCGAPAAPAGETKPAAPSVVNEETKPAEQAGGNAVGGGSASDSYNAYIKAKSDAYDRINKKIEGNSEIGMAALMLMPVTMVDISLIPLTIVSVPEGAAALSVLGMEGINITGGGNEYSITYTSKDSEGNKQTINQTCKYDPASDSMQSRLTDGNGKEAMFFEYVKIDGGYASQYYYDSGDGSFQQITSFFNDTDTVAFGMKTLSSEPASIMGNKSLGVDFVKDGETYFLLQGDKLTIYQDGEAKTY